MKASSQLLRDGKLGVKISIPGGYVHTQSPPSSPIKTDNAHAPQPHQGKKAQHDLNIRNQYQCDKCEHITDDIIEFKQHGQLWHQRVSVCISLDEIKITLLAISLDDVPVLMKDLVKEGPDNQSENTEEESMTQDAMREANAPSNNEQHATDEVMETLNMEEEATTLRKVANQPKEIEEDKRDILEEVGLGQLEEYKKWLCILEEVGLGQPQHMGPSMRKVEDAIVPEEIEGEYICTWRMEYSVNDIWTRIWCRLIWYFYCARCL